MDTDRTIADLCRRYGVPREFGNRLRPLLERARGKRPKVRLRLLRMVELSFEEEARRLRATMSPRELPLKDWNILKTVAGVLHGWTPPLWLRIWEETRQKRRDDAY